VSDPLTDEQLAEWERLANAATPGPWEADMPDAQPWTIWAGNGDVAVADIPRHTLAEYGADANFIATSHPQNVLALLAEVRRLRNISKGMRETLEYIRANHPWSGIPRMIDHTLNFVDSLSQGD